MMFTTDIHGPVFEDILREARTDAIAADPEHASDSIPLLLEALTHSYNLPKE